MSERLEEIKRKYGNVSGIVTLDDFEYNLLIEQTERVQEFEEKLNAQIESNQKLDKINRKWMRENKRYRELLEKIKEMTRYDDCREAEIYELVSDELEGEE